MNFVKDILGRIFALWAAIVFIVTIIPTGLIMWVIGLIDEPKRTIVFRKVAKIWISIYLFLIGCSLKLKGLQNFKKDENYIIICNHNSFMDVLVTTPFIPGPNKTIAKISLSKIPLFGLIYKRGSVLVDRHDKNSRINSFVQMKNVLAAGMHMAIYPEGTRNKTDKPLKEFHNGAFRLAVETQTRIMPAIIFNTKKAMPVNKSFFFWPTKMEVHFLPAMQVNASDDYEMLKEKNFKIMSDYYSGNFTDQQSFVSG
jgi:1-acyl-sn-glycerol-3-phosphate acyltransferase